MSKRCQVCDGPVANGRCRLCGMPYRNDEILYHLNENRSDHYRHATPKAREIMRRMEVPQKEQTPEKRSSSRNQSVSGRVEKQKKKNTAEAKGKTREHTEKSDSKTTSWVAVLISVIVILCSAIPGFIEYGRNKIADITSDYGFGNIDENEMTIPEDVLYTYTLFEVGEMLIIGETIPAGEYLAVIEDGSAELLISEEESGRIYTLTLTEEDPQVHLNLEEGTVISLQNTEHDWNVVDFYQCSFEGTDRAL